jgi:hypothetical protein
LLLGVLGALVEAAALWFGIPYILLTLSTVSTDDAFVNGHVTFVAARVHGQVSRVLVDDNNRVHKGDLLIQLDTEPFQDAVAVKKAAVDSAQAICRRPGPRCAASKHRPGAGGGICNTPWRTSRISTKRTYRGKLVHLRLYRRSGRPRCVCLRSEGRSRGAFSVQPVDDVNLNHR